MLTNFRRFMLAPVAVVAVLLLAGCSPGPADRAEEFLSLMAAGEVTEANELATENTAKLMSMASSFGVVGVDPDFDFQLVEEEIDGNRATVTYKSKKDGKIETIHLVKLDGDWKVHETKE